MAIRRIDLSGPIKRWKEARKGKEVRAANVEAFEQIQTVVNESIDGVNKAAEDVQSSAADVAQVAKDAADTVIRANETVDHADTILEETTKLATAAAGSAELSQSWAEGGTGARMGEDTNNSEYHSRQAKTAAQNAQNEADRASMYANFVTPRFILVNNRPYINEDSTVEFATYDNRLYFKLPA